MRHHWAAFQSSSQSMEKILELHKGRDMKILILQQSRIKIEKWKDKIKILVAGFLFAVSRTFPSVWDLWLYSFSSVVA